MCASEAEKQEANYSADGIVNMTWMAWILFYHYGYIRVSHSS